MKGEIWSVMWICHHFPLAVCSVLTGNVCWPWPLLGDGSMVRQSADPCWGCSVMCTGDCVWQEEVEFNGNWKCFKLFIVSSFYINLGKQIIFYAALREWSIYSFLKGVLTHTKERWHVPAVRTLLCELRVQLFVQYIFFLLVYKERECEWSITQDWLIFAMGVFSLTWAAILHFTPFVKESFNLLFRKPDKLA